MLSEAGGGDKRVDTWLRGWKSGKLENWRRGCSRKEFAGVEGADGVDMVEC